jgi:hypothetical protein
MLDVGFSSFLLNSLAWFFAGVGLGYIVRDISEYVRER